jgi:peptide/nickel transport system substrate-binding protein
MTVNSLLPVVNNDSSANMQIITLMFRPLLWIGTDLKIDWKQSIAQSIHVSVDRRQFTIRLKPWKWSNGKPVTATDVLACLRMIQEFGSRYANSGMGGMPDLITKAIVINARTVQISVKRPVNILWFELNGLSQLVPVPAWLWKKYSINTIFKFQDKPEMVSVVDGPYKLERYIPGRSVDFVRNIKYSGPPPALQHLRFKMYTSDSSAFWALKSGVIQAGMIPHYLYDARWMVKNLKTCVSNGGYGFNYVTLNLTNPKVSFLRDVKVRQALALAVNQPQIIRTAFHGLGVPSFNPVPTNPDTYLSPKMKKLVADPVLAYNPAKAKHLLTEAGWLAGPDGIRIRNGHKLMFTMLVPDVSQTLVAVSELLKEDWQGIGVDMRIRVLPFNLEIAKLHPHGKWEASMIVWSYDPDYYPSGDGLFNTGGGSNYGDYSNAYMDQLIRDSAENNGLKALYKYESYAYTQVPVIFLPYPEYIVKYAPEITHKQLADALYSVVCNPQHPQ